MIQRSASRTPASTLALLCVLSRRARLYGFNHFEIDSKRFTLCGPVLRAATTDGK
jgi:hypothetical protein